MTAASLPLRDRVRCLNSGHWQSRGLAAQWIFDGYDGTASTKNLVNSSRNAVTYTSGLLRHTSTAFGRGIRTTASSYAYAASSTDLNATTFSVFSWIDKRVSVGGDVNLICKAYPFSSGGWMLSINGTTVLFQYGSGGSWPTKTLNGTFSGSGAVCLAAVRDGTNDYLYANGIQIATAASATFGASTSQQFDFGRTSYNGTYYQTIITQCRYYSRALTAAEVAGIYRDPLGNVQSRTTPTLVFDAVAPSAIPIKTYYYFGGNAS